MKKKSSLHKISEIAKKYGVSTHTAEEVIRSQWEYAIETMRQANPYAEIYPIFKIKHLGKFIVTEKRQSFIKDIDIGKGKKRWDDNGRFKVLQASDRLSDNTEEHTSTAVQAEDFMAAED